MTFSSLKNNYFLGIPNLVITFNDTFTSFGVKQMVFIFISPASNTWLVSVLEYFEQCVHRELSAEDGILPTCIFTHRF